MGIDWFGKMRAIVVYPKEVGGLCIRGREELCNGIRHSSRLLGSTLAKFWLEVARLYLGEAK